MAAAAAAVVVVVAPRARGNFNLNSIVDIGTFGGGGRTEREARARSATDDTVGKRHTQRAATAVAKICGSGSALAVAAAAGARQVIQWSSRSGPVVPGIFLIFPYFLIVSGFVVSRI